MGGVPLHRLAQVELTEVLEMSLSLVIASVPVALPMVMKVTLSIGAKAQLGMVGLVGCGGRLKSIGWLGWVKGFGCGGWGWEDVVKACGCWG